MAKKFEVKPADAQILEDIEQREFRRRRTEKALQSATPQQLAKKYKQTQANIVVGRINDAGLRDRTIREIYKYNHGAQIGDPMARGEV